MFVVSKDRISIINMEQITNLYIGADGCTIKADYANGKGCQIGRYNGEKEAKAAVEIVVRSMQRNEVSFMPNDEEVRTAIQTQETKWHHATGKKMKGHGGS